MTRDFKLSESDRRELGRIANMIDAEAETWREGWAVWTGSEWRWNTAPDVAPYHIRVHKLERAIRYLRALMRAETLPISPQEKEAAAVAA